MSVSMKTNNQCVSRQLRRRRIFSTRRGASSVEFALIFPMVIMFFVCSVAFSQAFLLRDTAQHAAYKGARRGLVWNATTNDVQQEAEAFLKRVGVVGAEITTTPSEISNEDVEIRVMVRIPMNKNAWVASPFMPDTFRPGASVKLRRKLD